MSYTFPMTGFHDWATIADPLRKPAEALPRVTESCLVTACSYCDKVQLVNGVHETEWVNMEQCRERIGNRPYQLSHGICPECYQHIVEPILLKLRRRSAPPMAMEPALTTV